MPYKTFSPSRRTALLAAPLLAAGWPLVRSAYAQTPTGQVVVYASVNAQSAEILVDAVAEHLAGVQLDVVSGGTGNLLKRIQAESGSPRSDLFYTGFASSLAFYQDYLQAYRSPEIAAIPEEYVDKEGLWAASNVHVALAMLNSRQFQGATPTGWRDLADARFKGKIVVSNPENSSTAFTILWWIEQHFGADMLARLAANCVVTPSGSNVVRSVGQGEYAVGITYESIAYPYVAGGQRGISLMYAQDGTFLIPDNVALLKNGPNAVAAQAVYDLMLSRPVQIALLENAFRRPSRNDIKVSDHIAMPDLENVKMVPFDERAATADRKAFLARWQALPKAGEK